MKRLNFLFAFLILTTHLSAQDGKIIEIKKFILPDSVVSFLKSRNETLLRKLQDSVDFYRITYLSDGLKVTGYIAEPRFGTRYPCIISNRGGNRDFGQWDPLWFAIVGGRMASWGYVVVASQYRGNDGGEGMEEFGGKDVNDVLNLIPVLEFLPKADTSRIGMEGASRGGMMTYISLKRTCRLKAAVVTAGVADLVKGISQRPEMEKFVYAELIPDYSNRKTEELKNRSALYWADKMCKTTPLLIMQGSSDWRVDPTQSLELVQKLYEFKVPVRFILFEGADHFISEFRNETWSETKRHFDYYLRDGKKWPSLQPHGQ